MNKINLKLIVERVSKFFSNLGKVAIIIIAMGSGYAASEAFHRYNNSIDSHVMQSTKVLKETSSAINERGELVIIDRKTGTYQIFDNETGMMIFNLYATKIYYDQNNKN